MKPKTQQSKIYENQQKQYQEEIYTSLPQKTRKISSNNQTSHLKELKRRTNKTQSQEEEKIISEQKVNNTLKGSYTMIKWNLSQGRDATMVQYLQINQCNKAH